MSTSEQRRKTFESFRKERGTVIPIHGIDENTVDMAAGTINAKLHLGGRRWGYPLEFKMNAIRMVREQGLSIKYVHRKLDITEGTLKKWLDYYDLKRIPPKGSNEYPVNPQIKAAEPVIETQTASPPGERKEQIRNAVGLLKQAVDLLHIATRTKQPAQEPARHV